MADLQESTTTAAVAGAQSLLPRKMGSILLPLEESGDKDRNRKLDALGLHSVLISRGIMIPLDKTMSLISPAALDDDGCLTMEEFDSYLLQQDNSETSGSRRRLKFIKSLFYDIEFWWQVCLALGGALFAVPAFPDELSLTDLQVANMFMVGYFCFIACSCKYFIPLPLKVYKAMLSEEKFAVRAQVMIRQHAATYFSVTTPGQDHRHHDEKSPTSSAQLQTYIDEVAFGGDKDLTNLTKTDLELYLLKATEIARENLINAIFKSMDKDESGTITREELQAFVEDANLRKSLLERLYIVTKACIMNFDWVFGIVFCIGEVIGVAQNICIRFENTKEGLWVNEHFTVDQAAAYLFNIGCLVFVSEQFKVVRDIYDMEEKIKEALKNWTLESKEARTDEWVIFSNSDGLSRSSLNRLLEESGIIIPRSYLDSIFLQMDSDENDLISPMELQEFVGYGRHRLRTIWAWCFKDIVFLTYFVWEIACMCYIVAAYGIAVALLYKIGGVLFCVGGFNLLAQFIMQKKSDFGYIKNLRRSICTLKEKKKSLRCGLSTTAGIDEIDIETNINVNTTIDGNTMDKEKGIDVSSTMVKYDGYLMADSNDDKQDETTSLNDLETFKG